MGLRLSQLIEVVSITANMLHIHKTFAFKLKYDENFHIIYFAYIQIKKLFGAY